MDFARRAARNEELVRDVNRQIEEGASLCSADRLEREPHLKPARMSLDALEQRGT